MTTNLNDLFTELWVCTDCYFAHHYGRSFVDGKWYAGESDTPCDLEPLGRLSDLDDVSDWTYDASDPGQADWVDRYGDGHEEFTSRVCQGCGSGLGGSRYRLALRTYTHLAVYRLDLNYGGPEEGGWWYTSGTLVQSVPITEQTWRFADDLLRAAFPMGTHRFSVRPQGDDYRVEMTVGDPAAFYPPDRPRYE